MIVVAGVVWAVIAAAPGASEARSGHHGTDRGDAAPVPATAVLDWNAAAVATVRGALPAKFQLESDLYMAYVQASVYDAVVKIAGRYEPYHDFESPVSMRGASVPAAVAAAAYTALAYYFIAAGDAAGDDTAYLAGLASDGLAAGVAIGKRRPTTSSASAPAMGGTPSSRRPTGRVR
jgi:hypothetical protein